jgi:hypothetical protein
LFADHSHDATRPVPNLNGRSHSEMRRCPGSHVIVCLGDEVVRRQFDAERGAARISLRSVSIDQSLTVTSSAAGWLGCRPGPDKMVVQ